MLKLAFSHFISIVKHSFKLLDVQNDVILLLDVYHSDLKAYG